MRAIALMMVIVMVTCGSASCGGEVQPVTDGEPFVVRDSSGVRISESRDSAWTSETAQRLSGTPALEIGTLSGPDPATTFTFVRDVVRFPDGRTAVLDFLTRAGWSAHSLVW